jgi:hypothetical protein
VPCVAPTHLRVELQELPEANVVDDLHIDKNSRAVTVSRSPPQLKPVTALTDTKQGSLRNR